jgi:hypothetical protein
MRSHQEAVVYLILAANSALWVGFVAVVVNRVRLWRQRHQ